MSTSLLRWWREEVGNVVAPARCLECLAPGAWLCLTCLHHHLTTPVRLTCLGCERASRTGRTCSHCQAEMPLAGAVWAGWYRDPWVRRGVQWLKFRGLRQLAEPLAILLAARLPVIAPLRYLRETAVLVPIPLHPRRLRARGYNQSMELAQALAHLTGIPVAESLVRTVATIPQSQLAPRWRALNVTEAFGLTTPLPASRSVVLLVDDVITSGATAAAAGMALHSLTTPEPQQRAIWSVAVGKG